jgi:sterol desaturase/sphingolipid hydroxylase (fatty acid hydroxylase superfamily)
MFKEAFGSITWSLLIVTALYPLEWLFPAQSGQPTLKRLRNLIYMPIIIAFSYVLQPFVNEAAGVLLRSGSIIPALLRPPSTGISIVLFAILFALAWDLWQYWVHRLQHANKIFWATHKFHHSETALNATTHARTHFSSHLLYILLYIPMIILFGSLAPHWIAAFIMFRLWGYFNHVNLKLHLGFLTPVISGPQWHRIHHSSRPEHRNKNFASFFPFIDIIFGTYYGPHRDEYPETGLTDSSGVRFLDDATIEPFRIWRPMVWPNRCVEQAKERKQCRVLQKETVPGTSGRKPGGSVDRKLSLLIKTRSLADRPN